MKPFVCLLGQTFLYIAGQFYAVSSIVIVIMPQHNLTPN